MAIDDRANGENASDFRWVSRHWWSARYELRCGAQVAALVHINGSTGTAELEHRHCKLQRFHLPPYVTIRDSETDDLIARLSLIPKRGFLAEFEDGQSFRLGWTSWWRREWSWTNDEGGTVLLSRHVVRGAGIKVRLGPDPGAERKWVFLAVLELAMAKLASPWG